MGKENTTTDNTGMENKENKGKKIIKKILDILLLLLAAVLIMAAAIGIMIFFVTADIRRIDRENKSDPVYKKVMAEKAEKEKVEKEKEDKDEKVRNFKTSRTGAKYTRDSLEDKIGRKGKISVRSFVMGDEECLDYDVYGSDSAGVGYDEMTYYLFTNSKSADRAFKYIEENWFSSITDSGENYIQGWEEGVCDAEVESYAYISGNLIIVAEVQIVSGWAEPDDSDDVSAPSAHYDRIEFIKKKF